MDEWIDYEWQDTEDLAESMGLVREVARYETAYPHMTREDYEQLEEAMRLGPSRWSDMDQEDWECE